MEVSHVKCSLWPKHWEGPVCGAGADVSGVKHEDWICSERYAEQVCPWFRELEREVVQDD